MYNAIKMLGLVVITSYNLSAQKFIQGQVVDESNVALPYVNIGIPNQGIGTVSNENGKFELTIPELMLEMKVRFSHVSYEVVEKVATDIEGQIKMYPQTTVLANVAITDQAYKSKTIGSQSKAGLLISGFSKGDLGGEVGSYFNISQPSFIEEVGFYIKQNSFDTVKLRVNIYTVKDKLPDQKISANEFIAITNKQTGFVSYQFQKVINSTKDLIVTLEMIEHTPANAGSVYFSQSPPYLGKMYYRETSFDVVKKYIGGPMSIHLKIKQIPK